MIFRECKKCFLQESAEADLLNDIKERIKKLNADERCDEEEYSRRLSFCRECDELISGVCMKCGCYVEFRAAFKGQKCPNVSDRKW